MAEAAAGMSGSSGYREKPRSDAQNRKKGKTPNRDRLGVCIWAGVY